MLKQEELTEALHDGLKATDVCGTFCRAGIEIDEGRYRCWHNGTGRRDTDVQVVTATPVLALNKDLLAGRLKGWIEGLHKGERPDLNATMETRGPAMTGWPWGTYGHRWTDGTPP